MNRIPIKADTKINMTGCDFFVFFRFVIINKIVANIIAFILNISLIIPVLLYCSIFSKAIVITEYPAAAINPTDAGLNP